GHFLWLRDQGDYIRDGRKAGCPRQICQKAEEVNREFHAAQIIGPGKKKKTLSRETWTRFPGRVFEIAWVARATCPSRSATCRPVGLPKRKECSAGCRTRQA